MMGVVLNKYKKRVQNEQLCAIQFYNTVVIDNKQLVGGNYILYFVWKWMVWNGLIHIFHFDWFDG